MERTEPLVLEATQGPSGRLVAGVDAWRVRNVAPSSVDKSVNVPGMYRRPDESFLLKFHTPLVTNRSFWRVLGRGRFAYGIYPKGEESGGLFAVTNNREGLAHLVEKTRASWTSFMVYFR